MHKKVGEIEKLQSPVFPEKNLMTRDVPAPVNECAEIKLEQHSFVLGRIYAYFYTVFPCFEPKKIAFQDEDFSLESHSSSSAQLRSPRGDVLPSNSKATNFALSELSKATSKFSPSRKIGQGGFGIIYKGKLQDGTIVAVKRARKEAFATRTTTEFHSEVDLLARVYHLNLVRLIGYLEEGDERMLVEEYVANGNLRQHLDCEFNVILDLHQRLDIAIDVAHGLTYLHLYADQPIIHRDVKSSNILLTESFRAKVADFGLSRVGPIDPNVTHVSTKVKGTAGYLDPEYLKTYKLTSKSDVYAFGILLVELITGRRPIERDRSLDQRITVRWAYKKFLDGCLMDILDPRLEKTEATCHVMEKIFELSIHCSAPTKHDRPTMKQITECLWLIRKDFQRIAQNSEHQING